MIFSIDHSLGCKLGGQARFLKLPLSIDYPNRCSIVLNILNYDPNYSVNDAINIDDYSHDNTVRQYSPQEDQNGYQLFKDLVLGCLQQTNGPHALTSANLDISLR